MLQTMVRGVEMMFSDVEDSEHSDDEMENQACG